VTVKSGDHPLLQVRASSFRHEQFFLIDPNGGSLAVDADGGQGGSAGSGGRGGRGGSGGSGFPPGLSGHDGRNGFDGHAGPDGVAGTIVVSVDPAAQPFLGRLHLSNNSGSGRVGPAPVIRVEPVPPLW
jgi:hypothetical protein